MTKPVALVHHRDGGARRRTHGLRTGGQPTLGRSCGAISGNAGMSDRRRRRHRRDMPQGRQQHRMLRPGEERGTHGPHMHGRGQTAPLGGGRPRRWAGLAHAAGGEQPHGLGRLSADRISRLGRASLSHGRGLTRKARGRSVLGRHMQAS